MEQSFFFRLGLSLYLASFGVKSLASKNDQQLEQAHRLATLSDGFAATLIEQTGSIPGGQHLVSNPAEKNKCHPLDDPDSSALVRFDRALCKFAPSSADPPPIPFRRHQENAVQDISTGAGPFAYASENSTDTFIKFDLGRPETLIEIGSVSGVIRAGDFSADRTIIYAIEHTSNTFVQINRSTGQQTTIGPAAPNSGHDWTGLSVDPTTSHIYASSCDLGSSVLYTIDPATGAVATIGAIIGSPCVIAIGVDGAGQLYGFDIITDLFLQIDKTSGAAVPIGPLGFDSNFSQGLDFDPITGKFYLAAFNNDTLQAELRTVDATTGLTQMAGSIGEQHPGGEVNIGWLGVDELLVYLPTVIK